MKKLLMICYHYPPANNGGVQRSAKFVKYLPGYGWKPVVVTTSKHGSASTVGGERVVYAGELRNSLFRKLFKKSLGNEPVKAQTSVAEGAKGSGPKFRRAVMAWIEKWLLFPDDEIRWTIPALVPSLRVLMRDEADAIFTTSPPVSVHLLGLVLQKLTGKAWLMDLRDPWTLEPLSKYLRKEGLRRAIEKYLERLCFRCADQIVLNTPEAARRYAQLYPESTRKTVIIRNGFDAEEIDLAKQAESQAAPWREIKDAEFVISHVGNFLRNTDQDTTPYALLAALKDFLDNAGERALSVRVVFAGNLRPETIAYIAELGLHNIVETPGKITHFDAMRLIWKSDLLLVFDPRSQGETYVHGKIYEYVGMEKPILGMLPDGASRDLLKRYGRVLLASPNDPIAIRRAFEKAILEEAMPEANPAFDLRIYDRKRQAGELSSCLDYIVRKRPRR